MPPTVQATDNSTISIPAAPSHLPEKAAQQWQAAFVKAFKQAQLDTPGNERAQRVAALKTANSMLAVPAPTCADDINKLEGWQVIKRGTRVVAGVEEAFCVTSDGRKYVFPVIAPKGK